MNGRTIASTAIAPALWGTTYVVTTELLPAGRPLLAATLRALPAGIALLAIGGRLPTNMDGGNLSGSYMQGWSHVAEVVRQLRHEAGERQIPGVQVSMSSLVQTDQAHPLIFVRGE